MDATNYWQPTGANNTMRHIDRSECDGGADEADMTPEQRQRLLEWMRRGSLMHVCDAGEADEDGAMVRMACSKCGHETGWLCLPTTEAKRGKACPNCSPTGERA